MGVKEPQKPTTPKPQPPPPPPPPRRQLQRPSSPDADAAALRGDWARVGGDIGRAMDRFAEDNGLDRRGKCELPGSIPAHCTPFGWRTLIGVGALIAVAGLLGAALCAVCLK